MLPDYFTNTMILANFIFIFILIISFKISKAVGIFNLILYIFIIASLIINNQTMKHFYPFANHDTGLILSSDDSISVSGIHCGITILSNNGIHKIQTNYDNIFISNRGISILKKNTDLVYSTNADNVESQPFIIENDCLIISKSNVHHIDIEDSNVRQIDIVGSNVNHINITGSNINLVNITGPNIHHIYVTNSYLPSVYVSGKNADNIHVQTFY